VPAECVDVDVDAVDEAHAECVDVVDEAHAVADGVRCAAEREDGDELGKLLVPHRV
jgi:hypothetical protein